MIAIKQIDLSKLVDKIARKIREKSRKRKLCKVASKQHNWDYAEIYELIATKLECMLDYAEKDTVASTDQWRPEWIRRAIRLAKHLAAEDGYPEYININNAKRYQFDSWINMYAPDNRFIHESFYDRKAKYIFFKILDNYINNWWD